MNDIQRLYVQARCVMMTQYLDDSAWKSIAASVDAIWDAMTPDERLFACLAIPADVYSAPLDLMYAPSPSDES